MKYGYLTLCQQYGRIGQNRWEEEMAQQAIVGQMEEPTPVSSFTRVGAWAGVGFALVYISWIAIVISGPTFVEPGTVLREFFASGGGDDLRIGSFIVGAAYLFLLFPFVVALEGAIEKTANGWGRLAVLGAGIAVAVSLVDMVVGDVFALTGIEGLSDSALETIWTTGRLLIVWVFHLATGMWVAAASVGVLRGRALPRWLGWLGLALLIPQAVAASWLLGGTMNELHDAAGGIGQIGAFLVWIPAVSIAMLRHRRHEISRPQH
jgi:hypothetical protein